MGVSRAGDRPFPLPRPRSPTFGREDAVHAVCQLALRDDVALLTLIGPGGVGKTRLAVQAAAELVDAFPAGVAFVALAQVTAAELFFPAVAQALSVRETAGVSAADNLVAWLHERAMLLVLDNLEQLHGAASAVASLLESCPRLVILATSRIPLHLSAEHEYPVAPLNVPAGPDSAAFEVISQASAVQLFCARARAVAPTFALTPEHASAVADICRRLDGLPLAIELAAARVKLFAPAVLLAQLTDRLRLLTGGPHDAPARQQTLRDTIAWSDALLAPEERALFRRLAVFAGGFTLAAAEAVFGDWDSRGFAVLDGLLTLADQNLLASQPPATDAPEDAPRFGMLETIRAYGLEQLAGAGELDEAQRRQHAFFSAWAERWQSGWNGPELMRNLQRSDSELHNVRAALEWAVSHDPESALRFNWALSRYWVTRGFYGEGRRWFERARAHAADSPTSMLPNAMFAAGFIAATQGDYEAGWELTEQSLAIFRQRGERQGIAECAFGLSRIAMWQGDIELAGQLLEQSLGSARELGLRHLLPDLLGNLFTVRLAQGDLTGAAACLDEALPIVRDVGDAAGLAIYLIDSAELAVERRQLRQAEDFLAQALTLMRDIRDPKFSVQALEIAAWLAAARAQPARVARLLGAVDALRETIGMAVAPLAQRDYDRYVPDARAALGEQAWIAAWEAGRLLSLDDALVDALALVDESTAVPATPTLPTGNVLSVREREVARLLVDGRSNQEIAAALFISPHTAANHVASIMNKLGLESRTAVATWAVRHELG